MTAALIFVVIAWTVIGAMLWFIFGPMMNDQPVGRALAAVFWPFGLVGLIALALVEALTDAAGGDKP